MPARRIKGAQDPEVVSTQALWGLWCLFFPVGGKNQLSIITLWGLEVGTLIYLSFQGHSSSVLVMGPELLQGISEQITTHPNCLPVLEIPNLLFLCPFSLSGSALHQKDIKAKSFMEQFKKKFLFLLPGSVQKIRGSFALISKHHREK